MAIVRPMVQRKVNNGELKNHVCLQPDLHHHFETSLNLSFLITIVIHILGLRMEEFLVKSVNWKLDDLDAKAFYSKLEKP